jgi:serine/threonine protein kinase
MAKLELYHLAQKRERELLVKSNLLSKCVFLSQQKRDEGIQEFNSEIMNMQNWGARQLEDSNGLKIQAKSLVAQGVNMVASTKGDLWAMGLTLFEMRTGKYPLALFTNTPVLAKMTLKEFYILLKGVKQEQIDALFSTAHPNTLEFLNFQMLTLDPANRPSAKVCLDRVQELRKNNVKFL